MSLILRTEYKKSEQEKIFDEVLVEDRKKAGFLLVRYPRFDGDPYIMSRPSQVLVTYMYMGREITVDKKEAIKRAYNKYLQGEDKIKRFTETTYQRFLRDLDSGKIVARYSMYKSWDIYFYVR